MTKELGLIVDTNHGGHIHIDKHIFNNDPLLFLNFFIDCQNHPELFLGVFGLRYNNPPIAIKPKVLTAFKELLNNEEFVKKINHKEITIQQIAVIICNKIYIDGNSFRNYALNLENLLPEDLKLTKKNSFETVEIRGLEAQKNEDEVILIINYFKARIEKLKKEKDILTYHDRAITLPTKSKEKKDAPEPSRIREDFEALIKDTPGLEWKDYELFLKDIPIENTETIKFTTK